MSASLLRELWNNRSIVSMLAINDLKLRYRSSVLGFLWSFLEPLLMLSVLYLVFTNIFKTDIENYPLYLLLGLIIWYMFNRSTSMGLSSLLDKRGIISHIYFRREIVVISSCITAFLMMLFEFIVFGIFLAIFNFIPSSTIFLLPLLLANLFILSLGVSLALSVLTVHFRDIRFIWNVVLQAGFFLAPIIYTLEIFPENIQNLLRINPLVHIIEMAHGLVLYNQLPSIQSTIFILISTGIIFVIGYSIFKIKSKRIVEEL